MVRAEKEIKGIHIGKDEVKLSLFADDKNIVKLQDIKLTHSNLLHSYTYSYTKNEKTEREIKETMPFTIVTKRIKYLGVYLPKETKTYT